MRTDRFNGHLYMGVSAQECLLGMCVCPEGVCPGVSSWGFIQGVYTSWPHRQTPWTQRLTPPDPEADTPFPIACWNTHPLSIACWNTYTPVNRMTDMCKNITLPQTSFVGSNKTPTTHFMKELSPTHNRGHVICLMKICAEFCQCRLIYV